MIERMVRVALQQRLVVLFLALILINLTVGFDGGAFILCILSELQMLF